jgi:serine-type D-Ala-D-Ala carboxypeptidase/endopeptidase (penicillin-binding protein 4)
VRPGQNIPGPAARTALEADLDAIFADPLLSRAMMAVRVDTLGPSATRIYSLNSNKLVMPASNMKVVSLAVAADRLGWDFTFETRLDAVGQIDAAGALQGDLVVVGTGDPSLVSLDFAPAALFDEWAEALWQAGVRRVDGRLIGDDNAMDDEGRGAGWAWDDLLAAYAAPTGALSYNENAVIVRVWPGEAIGEPARVEVTPPGHGLDLSSEVLTGDAQARTSIEVVQARAPGASRLVVRGVVPAGGAVVNRAVAVDNPTRFFVGALQSSLLARGIAVRGGAWDIDDVRDVPAATGRRAIASRQSPPLSALALYYMKASQNFYAETVIKALSRQAGGPGTAAHGRAIARDTLQSWGITPDMYVMADGSGLSRYDYVSADAMVMVLERVWQDARLRGPFLASLPVSGRDGTLETRMRGGPLDGLVQAKTGTIMNVRSLSGFLDTRSGERLVFAMIANHFTAPSAQIDAIVERALLRLMER